MRCWSGGTALLALCLSVVLFSGCTGGEEEPVAEDKNGQETGFAEGNGSERLGGAGAITKGEGKSAAKKVDEPIKDFDEPAQSKMPEVVFSTRDAESNVLGVGDKFPQATLPDLEGNERMLSELMGEKLTVVGLVQPGDLFSEEPLTYIGPNIVKAYSDRGVRAIAIHVGGTAEEAREFVESVGAEGFPNLHDADKQFYTQLAKERLPRVYLVNAEGEIIWFDIVFENATQRNLKQAIEYSLKQSS